MGYVIRMPKLGLEMEEGTLLEWTVEPGEEVSEGDVVAEVESEKSVGEVEAREDGVVRRVYLEEGESVPPGTPIGIFAEPEADISDLESEAETDLEGDAEIGAGAGDAGSDDTTAEAAADGSTASASGSTAGGGGGSSGGSSGGADVKASPRAERRAEELGVDLTGVEGTGPGGAVTADDVEAAADDETGEAAADVKASPRARQRSEELGVDLTDVEGTGPGGAITESDVEGAAADATETAERPEPAGIRRIEPEQPADHRYRRVTAVADEAAAEALLETTEAVRAAFEDRVTLTDVLVVVASAALADCPTVNGTLSERTHQVAESQHVAVVTETDGELTETLLADAAERSLGEVVEARKDGSDAAGEGPDPTFTLANAAETEREGRLCNPPAVAALEVDPTYQRAVPGADGVDLRPLVSAGLTYDARAVDAADAEAFLETFFDHAERASELALSSYRGRE